MAWQKAAKCHGIPCAYVSKVVYTRSMTNIGYARVSTRDQNDDSQVDALTEAGCAREDIYVDKVTGKLAHRPELDKALARIQPGDVFVITRLSRAMRSVKHMIALTEQLAERGASMRVLKQDIDTSNGTGRLVFHILAAIDEWQRELIVEGTLEGLESAKAKGHRGGRPRALTDAQVAQAHLLIDGGTSAAETARMLKVSRAALYRAFDREE